MATAVQIAQIWKWNQNIWTKSDTQLNPDTNLEIKKKYDKMVL